DALGRDVYTLNDLKSLQDWTLQREFRRLPRIADVVSSGGTVKRYEIHPDPDRLRRYGVTLAQLTAAVANSNANVGGDYLTQGHPVLNVRGVGLLGDGRDPAQEVLGMTDPHAAAAHLRAEEQRRLREIRQLVLASVNNVPVRVDDVVEGGPLADGQPSLQGVVVGHQTRLGKVSLTRPRVAGGAGGPYRLVRASDAAWVDADDKVQGIVLLRKNEDSLPALRDVQAKVKELNETPGRLLPGVKIEPYYDRTELIGVTTETVRENLL